MNNPDTDNTGHKIHRTKVRENRRAIKYGQSRNRQHWVHSTQDEDKQKRKHSTKTPNEDE
jgi:hypothetical protein